MPKIGIVTDSIACIPEEMMDELNILWVPYYIHRDDQTLLDRVTATSESFFEWMLSTEKVPTTANPSPGEYLSKYVELAEQGVTEIASIHISSKGSGAVAAATAAKKILAEKFPKVRLEVLDSLNVQMAQGWMVIEAARAALAGASFNAIIEKFKKMVPVTRMIQTADTLKYLYLGGRIGGAKHLVASVLDIKPIITAEDGLITALGQARTTKKVYKLMVDKLEEAVGQSAVKIAYVHAAAQGEAEKLKALVEQRVEVVESLITDLAPALGVHTGPGTVGFCYYPVPDTAG
jgi:DegV family protein with EDD domain